MADITGLSNPDQGTQPPSGQGQAELAEWAFQRALPAAVETPGLEPGITHVVHSESQVVTEIDARDHLANPARVKANRQLSDLPSLVAYLDRFQTDHTAAYVSSSGVTIILDDHTAQLPMWCGHTAQLIFERTQSWKRVVEVNNKPLNQEAFANLVEDLATYWMVPDGATMLEVAQTIEIAGDRVYKSARRTTDGAINLSYVNDTSVRAGTSGDLKVPARVELAIQAYEGIPATAPVKARLRTRLTNDIPSFTLILDRTAREIEMDARSEVQRWLQNETSIPVHLGTP